ncbi:complement resistance protein TraT [Burkholderia pyrrocinia]|uniref:complement resistance protein TraT n=1 Tax=Burkholderia pyrrocinia TaxID=60550 RepID=UPI00201B772B|nr:complement resistance protein TraT [Burkholderia pyrrocinia]
MNSTLYTAVLIGLALLLVAMFAFGFYWLATKDRPTSPKTPAPSSPSSCAIDEHDEWEAQAPYPDHALDALRRPASVSSSHAASARSSFAPPEFDEPLFETASPTSEARHAPPPDYFSYAPQRLTEAAASPADTHGCPHCGSARIETLNVGRRTGSTIGSVAGATGGFAMALSGAEAGAAVGAIGGPVGAVFGGLAGAVVAGLLGSAAGSVAGSAVGAVLDDNVFDNHRCLTCGHSFGSAFH